MPTVTLHLRIYCVPDTFAYILSQPSTSCPDRSNRARTASVGGLVPGCDVGGDAAPVGDLEALAACPFADGGLIVASCWRGGPAGSPGGSHAAPGGDVELQGLGKLVGVLLREINL